jgi:hypothetical protein
MIRSRCGFDRQVEKKEQIDFFKYLKKIGGRDEHGVFTLMYYSGISHGPAMSAKSLGNRAAITLQKRRDACGA